MDERFDRILERLRHFAQWNDELTTAAMQPAFDATPQHQWPPPPDTAHPALAAQAAFVRRLMSDGHHTVVLPRPSGISMATAADTDPVAMSLKSSTLAVRRVWALAPYVGDPFVYVWLVAVDEANRWVSGEAHGRFTGYREEGKR